MGSLADRMRYCRMACRSPLGFFPGGIEIVPAYPSGVVLPHCSVCTPVEMPSYKRIAYIYRFKYSIRI